MSAAAWFRMNATANSGSIPDEQPAMIEIVPVGATVVTLQLRSRRIGRIRPPSGPRAHVASGPQIDRSHSGNTPRCSASRSEATFASSSTNCISRRPRATPSSELYGTPRRTNRSAHPITPSPIRRIRCASWPISGSGYLFASMTLSRKWMHRCTAVRSRSQSTSPSLTNRPTLIDPRLHTS